MKTDADVAYYHAAVKVKGILVGVITSLGAVLLPRVSYYVEKGMTDEFRRLIGKAVNYVFLTAAPLMVYFMIFAGDGILFLSGPAYESAVLPMKIIMPTLLFIGLSNVTGIQILVPTGREKTVLYSEIAGALVDLVLNLLLIPKMASAGAAIGTLAAEAVVLAVQVYALKEEIGAAFRTVRPGKILVSLAAGCAASFWVIFTGLAGFPALLVSAACFFAAYGAVLLLTKEELATEIVFGILAEKLRKLVGKS
jgi:O-antigen/teichoic acid export membrane protein